MTGTIIKDEKIIKQDDIKQDVIKQDDIKQNDIKQYTNTQDNTFTCNLCNKTFKSDYIYQRHINQKIKCNVNKEEIIIEKKIYSSVIYVTKHLDLNIY